MALSITTLARTQDLTRLADVKAELGLTSATDDAVLERLIDEATSAIQSYTGWKWGFGRQVYSETVRGYGGTELALSAGPLVAVSTVTGSGSTSITDYSIDDRDQSTLYRQGGWDWTAQYAAGFCGWQRWPGPGIPQDRSEQPDYTIAYTAGYLLPPQHVLDCRTISAAAADNSFNDTASGFPALLKSGDVIEVSGMVAAANNGRFLVTGTPTAAKIVVSATLTLEAAGTSISVRFRGRPDHRQFDDVEKAAIETVKSWYLTRKDDSDIVEKQVGPMRLRRHESRDGLTSLPPTAAALLTRWMKRA